MYKEYEAPNLFPQTDQDSTSESFPLIDMQWVKSYKSRRRLGKSGRNPSLNLASDLKNLDKKNNEFSTLNHSSGQHGEVSSLKVDTNDSQANSLTSPINFLRASSRSPPPSNHANNAEINSAVKDSRNHQHVDLKFHHSAPLFLSSECNARSNGGLHPVGSAQKPSFMFANPNDMNRTYSVEKNVSHTTHHPVKEERIEPLNLSQHQESISPLNLSQHHDSINKGVERLQIDCAPPKLSMPELSNKVHPKTSSPEFQIHCNGSTKPEVIQNKIPNCSSGQPKSVFQKPPSIQKEPSPENPFKRPADVGLVREKIQPVSCLNITRSFPPNNAQLQQKPQVPINHHIIQESPVIENKANTIYVNSKPYICLSLLGKGGTSKVFLVQDPSSNKLKAIKCVDLSRVDQMFANAYLNEIELLIKLQECDTVIRMYDNEYVENERMLYVVLEKGDTDFTKLIRNLSKEKNEKDPFMIFYYWGQILKAVKDIHDRGIIHSDLKPGNFLLVAGKLKLIDFGIASSLPDDMTSVFLEVTCGTLNYMSPEAIPNGAASKNGYKITCKSDVWSLGCILYNLVYGKTPFSHLSRDWLKMQAIVDNTHTIEFPSAVQGWRIPSFLLDSMKQCLNRDPKQRPTVAELINRLKSVCSSNSFDEKAQT